jgi:outer membrane protein TolC
MRLDLPHAIDLALTQNRELVKLAIAIESSRLSEEGARSEFAWTLRPRASGGVGSEQDRLQYGLALLKKYGWGTEVALNGQVSESHISGLDDYYRGELRLDVEQPLFRNVGRLMNEEGIRRAESGVRAARRMLDLHKTDLIVQVAQTYEDIIRLQLQVEADEKAVQRLNRLVRLTRARENQGRSSKVDTLRIELQSGQASSRFQNSREQWLSAQQDFADLLGLPLTNTFDLATTPLVNISVPDIDLAIATALSNRMDYAQVLDDYRDVQRGVRIARRRLWPDVRLVSRYGKTDEGDQLSDAFKFGDDEWFVGLQAATDFPMRQENLAYQQSMLDEQSAVEDIRDAESLVQRQVYQQKLAYDRARADILIAERNLNLAQSRLKLAKRMFEMGRGDNFAVSDSEDEFLKAEREYLRAQAEASVAGYRLLRVMGTLMEYPEELKPVVGEVSSNQSTVISEQ